MAVQPTNWMIRDKGSVVISAENSTETRIDDTTVQIKCNLILKASSMIIKGDEYEGRMTSIRYDAALQRTFAPGQTDQVLTNAYEIFLIAAGNQFVGSDYDLFLSRYDSSRMWQVLQRWDKSDFNPSSLSSRIGGWNIDVDVAYGENEMHFYFYMSR